MPPARRHRLLSILLCALTVYAGALHLAPLATAQEPAPVDAAQRLYFVPEPGLSPAARAVVRSGAASQPPIDAGTRTWLAEQNGILVQNLGEGATRALAIYHRPDGPREDRCADCAFAGARCSASLAPGERTILESWWAEGNDEAGEAAPVSGLVSAVYALNEQPAALYGPAWIELLAAAGLAQDTRVADVICGVFAGEIDLGWGATCPSSALLAAFTQGAALPFAPGASTAPLPGEPIGVVVAPLVETGLATRPAATIDRYRAPSLSEVDAAIAPGALGTPPDFGGTGGPWVYELPGAVGNNPEEVFSVARLHNTGLQAGCATVRVEAWRTGSGFRGAITTTIAAGAWATLDARRPEWELTGSANLRIISDRPLATALTTRGYGFSLSRPGTPAQERARIQLAPLAYQAFRPFLATNLWSVQTQSPAPHSPPGPHTGQPAPVTPSPKSRPLAAGRRTSPPSIPCPSAAIWRCASRAPAAHPVIPASRSSHERS